MVDVVERSAVYEMLDKIQSDVYDGDGFQHDKWVEYVDAMKKHENIEEVVHCEDCKYWERESCVDGFCNESWIHSDEDHYCGFAKRREK